MPTSWVTVAAPMALEQADTVMESTRRPLVETGVNSTMLAAASEAVAVGARVVHAVTAARDSVLRYGVCVKTGVAVIGI